MSVIALDARNRIVYRETPWDERGLGVRTRELMEIEHGDDAMRHRLVEAFEAENARDGIGIAFTRIDAARLLTIALLQGHGFRYVGASYRIALASFARFREPPARGRLLALEDAERSDAAEMAEIAANDFHYGRFHEDPDVDETRARARNRAWIGDLFQQKLDIWVYRHHGHVAGFHAFRVSGGVSDLQLTGVKRGYEPIAGYFWVSIMHRTAQRGVSRAETMISAANLPIVNLYAALGFTVERLLVGLHKHYSQEPVSPAQPPN